MSKAPPRPSNWKPAFIVLCFFTLLSLAANAFLLWLVWNGWQIYQREVPPLREQAGEMGRSLQAAAEEPIELDVDIHEVVPIHLEVPIEHTLTVVVDDNVTVQKDFTVDFDLPVVGEVSKTFPLRFDVPIHIETPVHISLSVPISDAVPIDLDVPIVIDLYDTALGPELARLGQWLEDLAE
ncbi:MAG: hypothetical protein JXA37_11595 [Chloroflexia bacterium]|nr:hypothetical protein [Chloroflexia bacterium]